MISIESIEYVELLQESERLRGQGKFAEAATLMAGKYGEMTPECFKAACSHAILQHAKELVRAQPSDTLAQEVLAAAHRHHQHHHGQGGLNETAKSA